MQEQYGCLTLSGHSYNDAVSTVAPTVLPYMHRRCVYVTELICVHVTCIYHSSILTDRGRSSNASIKPIGAAGLRTLKKRLLAPKGVQPRQGTPRIVETLLSPLPLCLVMMQENIQRRDYPDPLLCPLSHLLRTTGITVAVFFSPNYKANIYIYIYIYILFFV